MQRSPYINKKLLTQEQISKCLEIHNNSNIPTTSISNIWTAFLLKSAQHLKNKGILTFVLPTELLQVNYAEKIRKFLRKEFNRIEIILFKKLSFSDIEQDTVILIAYKNYDLELGLFFSEVDSIRQLNDSKINFNKYTNHVDRKWASYVLSENEIKYLDSASKDCKRIFDVCNSKTGIVTAANSFFIVNKETVIEYDMQKYVKPIIQKSSYLDKSVEITLDYINKSNQKNKPAYLIDLNGVPDKQIPLKLKQYLGKGVSSGISGRYKCLKRKRWFDIPLIESSEAIFYKRAHEFPKILNNAHALYTTDSGYRIYMKDGYSVEQLLFGFYNSLTLLHSEINGRHYGGGVLELVPSEFKSLPVIIDNISTEEYNNFKALFAGAKSIEDFLHKHDYNILPKIGLKNKDIQKIQAMYAKIKFKRKSVWTRADKLFFLNTILNNFPCPVIYLQKEIDDNFNTIYNVVDGKQRLTTILDFYEGKLRITKSGDSDLDNKKWSQIKNREIKNQFMNYLFTVEILDDGNTTQWNEVFDRLNRNSKTLSRQELRYARYEGWFIKIAEKEAVESPFWREIGVSTTGRMRRMKDVEFISILLLVILEEEIVGFPQDNLDELYAKYDHLDELDEDHVDKEDSFNSKFKSVKRFITKANTCHNTFTKDKTFTKK
ncbi:MAG: hypothetical protein Rsou_0375 [Candidatus Ruthia sp. Asou_11_S2]|nr:hypothetical protein [Candidatus Ruthia sp. Asou_11_S2]